MPRRLAGLPSCFLLFAVACVGAPSIAPGAQPIPDPERHDLQSPKSRIQAITDEYAQKMTTVKTAQEAATIGRAARDVRDRKLESLFSAIRDDDLSSVTLEDAHSLALTAESIPRPDECIRFCKQMLRRGSSIDEAYLPWLRTLIAADRLDEAECELQGIQPKLSPDSFVYQMHLFLSLKYFHNERRADKAIEHIDEYLEWVARNLDLAPVVPFSLAANLDHYFDVYESVDKKSLAVERIATFRNRHIKPRLERQLQKQDSATIDAARMQLHFANCAICAFVEPQRLAAAEERWLVDLFHETVAVRHGEAFQEEVRRFREFVNQGSHHLRTGDCSGLVSELDRAAKTGEQTLLATDQDDPDVRRSLKDVGDQIKSIRDLVERARKRSAAVGTAFAWWPNVEWATSHDEARKALTGKTLMIQLWNPFSGEGMQSFRLLQKFAADFDGQRVGVVSLCSRCGFSWNSEKRAVVRVNGISVAEELAAWSKFVIDTDARFSTGMILDPAVMDAGYDFRRQVLTVIVGPDGVVREICEGLEPRKLKHMSNVVSGLINSDP